MGMPNFVKFIMHVLKFNSDIVCYVMFLLMFDIFGCPYIIKVSFIYEL